jgi:hypothetical protein
MDEKICRFIILDNGSPLALPCFSVPALRLPPSQWDLKTWKSQRAPLSYTKLITNAKKHFQKISCNKTGASELSYIFSSKLLLQIFCLLNKKMYQEEVLTS